MCFDYKLRINFFILFSLFVFTRFSCVGQVGLEEAVVLPLALKD